MANEYVGKLFILYGPSGSGKSTLMAEVLKKLPGILAPIITYTTRQARVNEIHTKDYYFINNEEFVLKQSQDYFIHVTMYLNNQYGASKAIIKDLESGKNLIAIFDRAGAQEVKNTISNVVLIWITAPLNELEKRLTARYQTNVAHYEPRLVAARQEIIAEENEKLANYLIVNAHLDQAIKELEDIIKKEIQQ